MRHPSVLPVVSDAVPIGNDVQVAMQCAASAYWAFAPVQFVVISLQYVAQSCVTGGGPSIVVVVPLSPQATRAKVRSRVVRMRGIVGEDAEFCN
jgi:hypothetical protein